MIGQLYREGQLYTTEPVEVFDHDWASLAAGVAIPHGLYDLALNVGYIHIGTSHDTAAFACDCLRHWWQRNLSKRWRLCSMKNCRNGTILPSRSKIAPYLIHVPNRQIAKLPNQPLQRFFGRILQGTAHWLNQSLDHWQRITVAHSAMQAFGQGHDRTGEEAYQMGDFRVSRAGNQRFEISDREGGLLQFQSFASGIKFMQVSDRLTQPTINRLVGQLASMVPQGRHEAEFAFRVREAEQTVRDFLSYMKTSVWDYEQGKFRLEIVDNQVLITSKQDGRGQIHGPEKVMQKNHRSKLVPQPSRLTWKDFDHLDSIRDRLNARIAADQERQIAPTLLKSVESNGKSHQVSQRSYQNGKGRALE